MIRFLSSLILMVALHAQTGYTINYVKSDRKWGIGAFHEPYNKISEYFQDQLIVALGKKGAHQTLAVQAGCCRISIELLEVSNREATFHKIGVNASASVSITDADGKQIYAKGYRGESRALAKGWKHLVRMAVEDMAKNVTDDENFTRVLATGKL